jgi:hypothetical protein
MRHEIKFKALACAALMLVAYPAFADQEASLIDSLKSKASDSLPKDVLGQAAPAEPAKKPVPAGVPTASQAPTPAPALTAAAPAPARAASKPSEAKTTFPEMKSSSSDGGYPVKTVRELLDLEAKLALAKSKERFDTLKEDKASKSSASGVTRGVSQGAVVPSPETLDLLAIFGYGNQRYASVFYNGQSYYRLSSGARFGPWSLATIENNCVVLSRVTVEKPKKRGKKGAQVITERNLCITDSPVAPLGMRVFGPDSTPAVRLGNAVPMRQAAPAVFQ